MIGPAEADVAAGEELNAEEDQHHRPIRAHVEIDQHEVAQQQQRAADDQHERPEPEDALRHRFLLDFQQVIL